MMKLRPTTRNVWFYVWLAFILVPMATGCLAGVSSAPPLWFAAILSGLYLILSPVFVVAMCGMNMAMQRLTGHFKPWRRPSLWTNPFRLLLHSLQMVLVAMVMVAATGAGLLLRLPWGDFDALAWALMHFSTAAGLWLGMFLSLRLFDDRFEPAPDDSPHDEPVK